MEIIYKEAISRSESINVTVENEGQQHRFSVVIWESPNHRFVTECHYLDKYDKPLKNSVKKKIRAFINEHFNEE